MGIGVYHLTLVQEPGAVRLDAIMYFQELDYFLDFPNGDIALADRTILLKHNALGILQILLHA